MPPNNDTTELLTGERDLALDGLDPEDFTDDLYDEAIGN